MTHETTSMAEERRALVAILKNACEKLGVTIVSPFVVVDNGSRQVEFPAFIPEFGSRIGTVVDVLDAPAGGALGTFGEKGYIGRSLINLQSVIENPVEAVAEMLVEWGYYGDPSSAPEFIQRARDRTDDRTSSST